jgi:hypothetical protein
MSLIDVQMSETAFTVTVEQRQTLDRSSGETVPRWYAKTLESPQCAGETPAAALRALAEQLEQRSSC